jgi:hypothetical protein
MLGKLVGTCLGHVWDTFWDFPALFGIPKTFHQCSIMGVFSKHRFGIVLGQRWESPNAVWDMIGKRLGKPVLGTFEARLGHGWDSFWDTLGVLMSPLIYLQVWHIYGEHRCGSLI